jgi:DNA-binding transcriptional MocR family regulator
VEAGVSVDLTEAQDRLAALWGDRSPAEHASRAAAVVFGTPGEWDPPEGITPARDLLYLSVGIPDTQGLPVDAIRTASERVLARSDDAAYRYGFGPGYFPLRRYLAERRALEDGRETTPDCFQLTNGSSGAIDLIVRSLIDPGDVIIAECPTYMGTLHNFRGVLARIELVAMDEEGLDTDALAELLDRLAREGAKVKLVYTISAFHNPTGRTLSLARRQTLLELAARHGFLILDDEAYRELWYETPPPPSLARWPPACESAGSTRQSPSSSCSAGCASPWARISSRCAPLRSSRARAPSSLTWTACGRSTARRCSASPTRCASTPAHFSRSASPREVSTSGRGCATG